MISGLAITRLSNLFVTVQKLCFSWNIALSIKMTPQGDPKKETFSKVTDKFDCVTNLEISLSCLNLKVEINFRNDFNSTYK